MNNQYSTNVYQFYVVTYNQKNLVLRSLDSVKHQVEQFGDGKLVELNIFDDCSTDGAIEVINVWVKQNQKLFNSIYFISNEINLGIRKNVFNARENISSFKYFFVAGDDLIPNSSDVFEYMDFCSVRDFVFPFYYVHGDFNFRNFLFWFRIEYFRKFPRILSKVILNECVLAAQGSYVSPHLLHDQDFLDFYFGPINYDNEDWQTWKYFFGIKEMSFEVYYKPVYNYFPSIYRVNPSVLEPLYLRIINRIRISIFDKVARKSLIQSVIGLFIVIINFNKVKAYLLVKKTKFIF